MNAVFAAATIAAIIVAMAPQPLSLCLEPLHKDCLDVYFFTFRFLGIPYVLLY
jgi:hypothetical protein